MNLLLDIGNTSTKMALFRQGEPVCVQNLISLDQQVLHGIVEQYQVQHVVASIVGPAPQLEEWMPEGVTLHVVNSSDIFPFSIDYATPGTLGVDRLVAVLGACTQTDNPLLVIDAGTCITVDYLDGNRCYRGGAIMPGLRIKMQALHTFTARLPLLSFEDLEGCPLVGRSTKECMASGTLMATALALDGFISEYRKLSGDMLSVFLTGGEASLIHPLLRSEHQVDSLLLFRGLNVIAEKDEK